MFYLVCWLVKRKCTGGKAACKKMMKLTLGAKIMRIFSFQKFCHFWQKEIGTKATHKMKVK